MYIHERKDWPEFSWDHAAITAPLAGVRHAQGRLLGKMEAMGFELREEATLATLTQDVIKTSEIEGERLDRQQVRSSIARRMGIDIGGLPPTDRNVEGVVEVMLDATRHYRKRLTKERLCGWHAALFPAGRSGLQRITIGRWRTDASGPMQVVSGAYGRERVHYEAPAHDRLDAEMTRFLVWLNGAPTTDPVLASALAHFWFITIHPFDDGNGRIARAIADLMLARSEDSPQRFYSLSSQIQRERSAYYDILETTQRGELDLTPWLGWYLGCLGRAIESSSQILDSVLAKAAFWRRMEGQRLNDRQRTLLNKLLDGFEGKLTTTKWAKLAKCSPDTALRDILDLVTRDILRKEDAGGRSTSYRLK